MNTKKQRIVNYLTKLDDSRTAERVAELVVQWCYDKFGPSKYSPFIPDVSISTEDGTNLLGEYVSDDNEIILCTDRYHSKKDEEYVNAVMVIPKGMVTRYWEIIAEIGAEFDGLNNS